MVFTGDFDLAEDVAFLSELVWQGLKGKEEKGKGTREKGQGKGIETREKDKRNGVRGRSWPSAAPASAQVGEAANPFLGSAPRGTATPESIPLSVKDAVQRALQYNLGLLPQEEAVKTARVRGGGRSPTCCRTFRREPAAPARSSTSTRTDSRRAVDHRPFNVFDARVYASQPIFDLRAVNDARAASANERAESWASGPRGTW